MVARISARCKKIKHEALDTGGETSDGLKPLINNTKQEVNHWPSEELKWICAKVLWLQQHLSPGQAWRMLRWTPLEVLGHLKRKKKTTTAWYKTPPAQHVIYFHRDDKKKSVGMTADIWFLELFDYLGDINNIMWYDWSDNCSYICINTHIQHVLHHKSQLKTSLNNHLGLSEPTWTVGGLLLPVFFTPL